MKKVVVLMMLMAGFTAMAQKGERGHGADFKDLSAEQMATLHTKKMTLDLDLTDAQQSKIKAFHLEKFKHRKAKMEERKAQEDSFERKKLTSDEKYALRAERLDAAIAHKAELKKILSEEQFEKWEEHHKKRGKHHKGKGHHSKGKRGK